MRTRLVLAATVLGALAMALPSALAAPAPAVLDGAKVKKLTMVADAPTQFNPSGFDENTCEAPRCSMLPFTFKPAAGVKGNVAFTVTWGSRASDFDAYVVALNGKSRSEVTHCAGATLTTGEKIFLPAGTLKSGKNYALLIHHYQSVGEKVTGTVELPGKDTIPTTVPRQADGAVQNLNCTL